MKKKEEEETYITYTTNKTVLPIERVEKKKKTRRISNS